jgi:hypothetical protein
MVVGPHDAFSRDLKTTQRLIVTLDISADQAPEYLCIVSESRSCPDKSEDSNGQLIRENDCATRELADLQDIGSLPADLSAGDVPISAPSRQTAVRRYKNTIETVSLDPDLIGALQSASRRESVMCDEMHEGCTPKVHLSAFASSGRIICGRDGAVIPSAHNARVAFIAISYHEGESRSGVQKVELHGTSATLSLQRELAASNFAFAQVIGGDYAFSATTSIGTNERIMVELHPRCALFGVELPARPLEVQLVRARIHVDGWGSKHDSKVLAQCMPSVSRTILPMNVPYIDSPGSKHLTLQIAGERDPATLEATWSGPVPASAPRLAYRSVEFSWRRNCLTGEWPTSELSARDASWNARCPRATIEGVSVCTVDDQADDRETCKYRCDIADSMSALSFPANVLFDRMRVQGGQDQIVYSWHDTISFFGQELRSFVAPSDRVITLEFADPPSWQDRAGDTLDGVRVRAPVGSLETIDLTTPSQRELLPSWIPISTRNITCSSRVSVSISGASDFSERSFSVNGGRVVLGRPHEFRSPWHPGFIVGGGVLGNPSEPTGGLYIPRRGTPYLTIGGVLERYIDHWPAAIEFRALIDLSKSIFVVCATQACSQDGSTVMRAWYGRANFGASLLWWETRRLHTGAGVAFSMGFPLLDDDVSQVGSLRFSLVTELLDLQVRLGRRTWLDTTFGFRWGEEHNYCMASPCNQQPPDKSWPVRYNSPFLVTRIRL